MDKNKALEILSKGIDIYLLYYDKDDEHARNGLHLMIGKIAMAVELGLLDIEEMDRFVDAIFEKYGQLQKDWKN